MAAAFFSGSAVTRNPMYLAFPMMMLISTAVTVAAGRGQRQGRGVDADRVDYLGYLSRLRATVTETAAAQRSSLTWSHPDPDTLWTLIGGPRMWERRASDPDFCLVRVGVGTQPLATRLVAPESRSREPCDPVTATALRRFLDTHSIVDAPITIGLVWRWDGDDRRRFDLGARTAARDDLPTGRAAPSRPVADRRRDQRPESSALGLAEVVAAQSTSERRRRGGVRPHGVSKPGGGAACARRCTTAARGRDRRPGRACCGPCNHGCHHPRGRCRRRGHAGDDQAA